MFSSGHGTTMIEGWSCDDGLGGNSDHAMTITSLNISPPRDAPRRKYQRTKWDIFEMHIKTLAVPTEAWSTKASTQETAAKLDKQIQIAIKEPVPLSKTSKHSKRWWTPEITRQKIELVNLKLTNHRKREIVKAAARKWTRTIRKAQ